MPCVVLLFYVVVLKDLSDKNLQNNFQKLFSIIRYRCVYVYEKYLIYIIEKKYITTYYCIPPHSTIKKCNFQLFVLKILGYEYERTETFFSMQPFKVTNSLIALNNKKERTIFVLSSL